MFKIGDRVKWRGVVVGTVEKVRSSTNRPEGRDWVEVRRDDGKVDAYYVDTLEMEESEPIAVGSKWKYTGPQENLHGTYDVKLYDTYSQRAVLWSCDGNYGFGGYHAVVDPQNITPGEWQRITGGSPEKFQRVSGSTPADIERVKDVEYYKQHPQELVGKRCVFLIQPDDDLRISAVVEKVNDSFACYRECAGGDLASVSLRLLHEVLGPQRGACERYIENPYGNENWTFCDRCGQMEGDHPQPPEEPRVPLKAPPTALCVLCQANPRRSCNCAFRREQPALSGSMETTRHIGLPPGWDPVQRNDQVIGYTRSDGVFVEHARNNTVEIIHPKLGAFLLWAIEHPGFDSLRWVSEHFPEENDGR